MGQILHGCARTTAAVRRTIQHSQESLTTLADRYGINPKTVHKWRRRSTVEDARMGPRPHSSVLSVEQEAIVVAFRKHTLLPLDDCLYALQATIPALTRSALHRCLVRHDINRLPDLAGVQPLRRRNSSRTQSAIFTLISPRSVPLKASCTCSSQLIAPQSSLLCGSCRKPPAGPLGTSFEISPRGCPTRSIRFLPTTGPISHPPATSLRQLL